MASYRVELGISSSFSEEGEVQEQLVNTCRGLLRSERNGWTLCWQESSEAGTASCRLHLATGGREAELQRSGAQSSRFSFVPGERRPLQYTVSGYTLAGAVTCHTLVADLAPQGGEVRLDYSLELGGICRAVSLQIVLSAKEEAHGDQ